MSAPGSHSRRCCPRVDMAAGSEAQGDPPSEAKEAPVRRRPCSLSRLATTAKTLTPRAVVPFGTAASARRHGSSRPSAPCRAFARAGRYRPTIGAARFRGAAIIGQRDRARRLCCSSVVKPSMSSSSRAPPGDQTADCRRCRRGGGSRRGVYLRPRTQHGRL